MHWRAPAQQPMTTGLPDGYMVHLPQKEAPRHLFGEEKPVKPQDSVTGHEQVEKTCLACQAVKVLVIPKTGDAWREWRQPGALTQSRWPVRCTGVSKP